MAFGIGDLRHRVTLQQTTEGRDDYGAVKNTWSDVATVWAAIEPMRGDELLRAQQVSAEVTTRIRIRHREGVTAKMRITSGSRIWDVRAVIHIEERRRELELLCLEAAA